MPNECWNYITITATKEELAELIDREFNSYTEDTFEILRRGSEAIEFKLWTQWHPNFEWLESLLTIYPSCWIKNYWSVEDGQAGIWIGTVKQGKSDIRSFGWEEMSIEEEMYKFRTAPK